MKFSLPEFLLVPRGGETLLYFIIQNWLIKREATYCRFDAASCVGSVKDSTLHQLYICTELESKLLVIPYNLD